MCINNYAQLKIVYLPTVSSTSRKGQQYAIFRAEAQTADTNIEKKNCKSVYNN